MAIPSEDEPNKRCVATAVALSMAHILTVVGADYQVYPLDGLQIDHFFLVNHAVFLSPVVVLLLMRKACLFVGIYAVPVLIIFVLRMHHVLQFHWFGINSMAIQNGDSLGFQSMLFDMLSAAIVACALLVVLPIH
jgi:hypothetical protein